MKALVLIHRWLGVGFCLLFAMWFASGIVMHFVPFPALSETERFAGLLPIDSSLVRHGPDEAAGASGVRDARRVRLLQRPDGPVYVISGLPRPVAVHAADLSNAAVRSAQTALQIAQAHARQRGLDATLSAFADLAGYDQWTVPNDYDVHRPLYRVALNDDAGTELYVSSATGEVVLGTTRRERAWNYAGSVAHWIYPTLLRSNWSAWNKVVWTLSFAALVTAVLGIVLGIARLRLSQGRIGSPFRGWHAWHHLAGLFSATFVLTWIFSGWLSMDHGLMFSTGRLSGTEAASIAPAPQRGIFAADRLTLPASLKEVEWFAFGERSYKRERAGLALQSMSAIGPGAGDGKPSRSFLSAEEVDAVVRRMAPNCAAPVAVGADDDYQLAARLPGTPVYRSICGDVWFHVDGGTGAVLERLDSSRRAYRWLYSALHTADFPWLLRHPNIRSALIISLCGLGFAFCMTGVVIAWRRIGIRFPKPGR